MTNFINKLTLWQKDLITLVVLNIFLMVYVIGLSDLVGVFFLAIFPGILIQRLLGYRAEYVWERVLHTVALSVSFVMIAGLLINVLLPILNIFRPLAQLPVLISFDVLLLIIIVINIFLKNDIKIFFNDISLQSTVKKVLPHLYLFLLPILAITGATILNNGGSNIITVITICSIVAFLIYSVSIDNPKRENLIVTGLYCVSLALLFASSMRSWHVLGWDINAELQVFRLTQTAMYWSMSHMQDAYNACLSITILPTIFSNFVHMHDEYIYKFLFQFVFALMPISIFYLVRTFTNTRTAVLAVSMLVSQVVFSHGMPALIRQEFGFLYFGLILLILFSPKLNTRIRSILTIIYGVSIIISHYSTTYITVLLLVSTVSLNLALYVVKKVFPRMFPGNISRTISVWYVIFLAVGTFMWGSVITKTSNNLIGFIDYSRSNIEQSFVYDTWSRATAQIFSAYPHYEDLNKYKEQETTNFRQLHPDMIFYEDKLTDLDSIFPTEFKQSIGIFGSLGKTISAKIFQVLKLILNNLLIILGMIILIYKWYIKKFQSSELIFLAASGFIALVFLLILPDALAQYNIERLYFQMLMIWALLSVTGGLAILSFIPNRFRFRTLGALYCILILFYSSIIFIITGGTVLSSINNFGQDYEKFYVHDSEVYAAHWLGERVGSTPIFSNSAGYVRLRSHGNVMNNQIFMTTLPSMIDKNSYVFLTHMNVIAGISSYIFYNEEYAYNTPLDFFNKNKNLIYNNGTAKIFK